MPSASDRPTRYGVVVFPGFQALDVFGPLDVLNFLSRDLKLEFSVLATSLDPVSTYTPSTGTSIGQSIVPTHTLGDPPKDLEVLLVPGGMGTRDIEQTKPVVDFIAEAYPKLRYLLTVCTGSALAARAGVLDGRVATSNKRSFSWVTAQGPDVKWKREARWVTDGNIWTSSGVSAGIDMMYAFVADRYGEDVAKGLARAGEYVRNMNPDNDPFAHPSK